MSAKKVNFIYLRVTQSRERNVSYGKSEQREEATRLKRCINARREVNVPGTQKYKESSDALSARLEKCRHFTSKCTAVDENQKWYELWEKGCARDVRNTWRTFSLDYDIGEIELKRMWLFVRILIKVSIDSPWVINDWEIERSTSIELLFICMMQLYTFYFCAIW